MNNRFWDDFQRICYLSTEDIQDNYDDVEDHKDVNDLDDVDNHDDVTDLDDHKNIDNHNYINNHDDIDDPKDDHDDHDDIWWLIIGSCTSVPGFVGIVGISRSRNELVASLGWHFSGYISWLHSGKYESLSLW